ncbi:recombinase family protein [Wolbachia endosymbiont of Cantharis cryptica]|uniref:recombinase family protein n=1 Tax=Wolbachia endosymbiont of Cantharis cryptica TaxID=3066132 RepID=UPI00376F1115
MTTVALYARVSSRSQAQNNTIESQIAELKSRIAADKHELLDEYEFKDDGVSGWNLERKGLDALRDKVAESEIDKIYIHSPDRLSRKSAHQMILLDEFEKAGVEVIFLNHKTENNPESKFLLGMQGLVAEYECTKIMERSRRGKLHRAKKGYVSVMSKAPYGYRYIKRNVTGEAKFEINEEEAKVVRELFEWIGQERISISAATLRLKERSIRTRTGQENWYPATICSMLRNPAYKGLAAFGRSRRIEMASWKATGRRSKQKKVSVQRIDKENWIDIPVLKIVDEELFYVVQKQLDENKKRARMQRVKGKKRNLLQGLVVCQNCGYAYTGSHCRSGEKTYSYYRCNARVMINSYDKCDNKYIRADMLEMVIWEEVKSLLKNPERIKREYQRRVSENKNDESSDKKFARRESQIKQGIEKLMEDYYSQGGEKYISEKEFKQTMKKMKERLEEIEEEKKKVVDQKTLQERMSIIINSIKGFYSSVKSNLDYLDWQTKCGIIRTLIKQINIGLNQVEAVFRIRELAQEEGIFNLRHCIERVGVF